MLFKPCNHFQLNQQSRMCKLKKNLALLKIGISAVNEHSTNAICCYAWLKLCTRHRFCWIELVGVKQVLVNS